MKLPCGSGSLFPRILLALVCAVAGAVTARAQEALAAIPEKLQPFVDRGEIAGAVMLVANRDNVLHLSAVGVSDVTSQRKLQTNDLFWIASMSKPITAVAVALLMDDGKLSFDDPLEKFLPEFRSLWVFEQQSNERRILARPERRVTLRDLLTHTSGMGEYAVTGPHWTLAEMSRSIAREPLRFQPGTHWAYSTAGFDVLGRVVEVVSGMPFAQFLQERLFGPLQMDSTTFWPIGEKEPRLATDYQLSPLTKKLEPAEIPYLYGGAITDPARPPLGGAGLFSTAEDISRFYRMMLNHGTLEGRRILKPVTVAEMTRKQTGDLRARAGMPWGLGFSLIEDPSQMLANAHLSPGTFGHGGAHGTNSWADPVRGLIYVFMIQRSDLRPNPDDSPMHRAYQEAVAAALAAPPPP